jgi:hypothetical protein
VRKRSAFMAGMDGILMGFAWMNLLIFFLGFLIILAGILGLIFWIAMIIDCAKRKMTEGEKVAWILILVFLHALGALIYYFAVKRQDKHR